MPGIGGGEIENTEPSLIRAPAMVMAPAMASADMARPLRCDQSFRITKLTPALVRVAFVSTSKPLIVKSSWYCGCAKLALSSCSSTASVRLIEAAGGSAAMEMTYP